MRLQCAPSYDILFQTRPCTIMIQNSSKIFFRTRLWLVINHYGTGTRLKKSVGRLEHTVIPHFGNDPVYPSFKRVDLFPTQDRRAIKSNQFKICENESSPAKRNADFCPYFVIPSIVIFTTLFFRRSDLQKLTASSKYQLYCKHQDEFSPIHRNIIEGLHFSDCKNRYRLSDSFRIKIEERIFVIDIKGRPNS